MSDPEQVGMEAIPMSDTTDRLRLSNDIDNDEDRADVLSHSVVAAMLDVIDAAQQIADCPDWPDGCVVGPRKMNALDDALARFREVAGE